MRALALSLVLVGGCFSKPEPPLAADRLTAGRKHACHIDREHFLRCWGENGSGQLGFPNDATLATLVTAEPGWTEIAAGLDHTCGIRDRVLYCWGYNAENQVSAADETTLPLTEVTLPGGAVPAKVFAGGNATCAIDEAGSAYCWGRIDQRRSKPISAPEQITPGMNTDPWEQIAISTDHACAVDVDGDAFCWGLNDTFQTGEDGPALDIPSARPYTREQFRTVAASVQASVAITRAGELYAWGGHEQGLIGEHGGYSVGTFVNSSRSWRSVAASANHVCAATTGGDVYCYGKNDRGALGTFDAHGALSEEPVIKNVREVVAGDDFTCGLHGGSGEVFCWGANVIGELGIGEVAGHSAPMAVPIRLEPMELIKSIAAGEGHTCVLVGTGTGTGNGRPICWGDNRFGQVKPGSTLKNVELPTEAFLETMDGVTAGAHHTCAIDVTDRSKIVCWGRNQSSQLGPNASAGVSSVSSVPNGAATWTQVAAGGDQTCAMSAFGDAGSNSLWCWGATTGATSATLQDVTHNRPSEIWDGVAVGDGYALALDRTAGDAQVVGWGTDNCNSPAPSIGAPVSAYTAPATRRFRFAAARSGGTHACVNIAEIGTTPELYCFGGNSTNQIESATQSCAGRLLGPPSMDEWPNYQPNGQMLSFADDHSCVIGQRGYLYCWGGNQFGELSSSSALIPLPELNADGSDLRVNNTMWHSVATSRYHTCAIRSARTLVECWGANRFGELGNGLRWHPEPVQVLRAP